MEIIEVRLAGDAVKDAAAAYGLQPGAMHRSVSLLGVQCTLHFEELSMPLRSDPQVPAPHVVLACFYLLSQASLDRLKQTLLPQLQADYPGTDIMLVGVPLANLRERPTSPTRSEQPESQSRVSSYTNPSSLNSAPISFARTRQFSSAIGSSEERMKRIADASESRPSGRERPQSSEKGLAPDSLGLQDIMFASSRDEGAPPSIGSDVVSSESGADRHRPPSVSSVDSFGETTFGSGTQSEKVSSYGLSPSPASTSMMSSSLSSSSETGSPLLRWRSRHHPSQRALNPEIAQQQTLLRLAIERSQELANSLGLVLTVAPENTALLFSSPPGSFSSASVPPAIAALIASVTPTHPTPLTGHAAATQHPLISPSASPPPGLSHQTTSQLGNNTTHTTHSQHSNPIATPTSPSTSAFTAQLASTPNSPISGTPSPSSSLTGTPQSLPHANSMLGSSPQSSEAIPSSATTTSLAYASPTSQQTLAQQNSTSSPTKAQSELATDVTRDPISPGASHEQPSSPRGLTLSSSNVSNTLPLADSTPHTDLRTSGSVTTSSDVALSNPLTSSSSAVPVAVVTSAPIAHSPPPHTSSPVDHTSSQLSPAASPPPPQTSNASITASSTPLGGSPSSSVSTQGTSPIAVGTSGPAAAASQVIAFFENLACAYQPPWLKQSMASYKKLGLDISIADRKTMAVMDVWRQFYQRGTDYVTGVTMTDLGLKSPLPDFFVQLTNIQSVNLSGNALSETHIKILFQLPQIGVLNLSRNQIKVLPVEIGRLVELADLDISHNQLEILPAKIEHCTSLIRLDVSGNRLLALPFGLGRTPLRELFCADNPFTAIPAKMRNDPRAIWAYLKQSLDGSMERWTRMRLMVVGPENIGKTRLVRRLSRRDYSPLSTDGIEVETFKMKLGKTKTGDSKLTQVEVRAYDFGGQEVFYPTHSFFIGPRSLYIAVFKLVADIDSINWQSLEYWLRTIKLLANSDYGKPSVIIVGTHLDEFESRAPRDQQSDILAAISKRIQALDTLVHIRSICFISNKSKKGIDQLRLAILSRVEKEEVLKTPVPSSWLAMDMFLTCLIEHKQNAATSSSHRPPSISISHPAVSSSSPIHSSSPLSSSPLSPTSPIASSSASKESLTKSGSKESFFSGFSIRGSSNTPNTGSGSSTSTPTQALRFISWTQFLEYAHMFNVQGDEEIRDMATFLHDMGSLLWYNSTKMRDVVILDPQWLSEVMASIISMKVSWKDGELPHSALGNVWKAYPTHLHQTLLSFLEHFEVAYPLRGTDKTIVPCMFNSEPGDIFKAEANMIQANAEKAGKFQRKYRFKGFLPLGFFDRMIVRIMHIQGVKMTSSWRYGIIVRMGAATGMASFDRSKKVLLVTVLSRSNQDILFPSILESIESLIKTSYHNIKVSRRVLTSSVSVLQQDEFDYEVVLDAFHRGERTFMCGKVAVPIEDMAPDICMSFIPELKNVKLGDPIGRGGFGVVYRGSWNSSDVAIKEVVFKSAISSANTEAFRQFAHEVWMMSKLSHPNLVHLHGITLHPLRMIMEFCPGMDLCNFLHNNPKLATEPQYELFRLRIAIDVAKGMQHLHSLSPPVIHRDLRSPNVFVVSADDNAETVAKIGDFGLAEFTSHDLNEALPTWQWLPPETFNAIGHFKYNERCDRWSFGIVLWEIFTGSEPYSEYFDEPRFAVVDPPSASSSIQSSVPSMSSLTASSASFSTVAEVSSSAATSPRGETSPVSASAEIQFTSSDPSSSIHSSSASITLPSSSEHIPVSPRLEKRPSRGATLCNVQNLKTAISQEGLRPTIPSHMPHSVKEIITRCWHADPLQRPDFAEIMSVLVAAATDAGLAPPPVVQPAPRSTTSIWRATAASQRANYFRQPITRSLHSTIPLESGVLSMTYNPATTEIWSGCSDGNVRIFNSKTRVRNVEVHPVSNSTSSNARIHQLLYVKSEPSPRIWSVSDRIVVWNPESRLLEKELFAPHTNIVRSMLYVESKQQVWTADVNGLVCAWDANTFSLLHTITVPELSNSPIFCMCLVDNQQVWLGSYSKIIVLDVHQRNVIDSWDAHSGYRIMAMTLVGSHVWTGSELRICIWDKATRKVLLDASGNKVERLVEFGVVSMITVKRPGSDLHVWSGDSNGTVTVWNTDLSKPGLAIYQVLNNHKKDSIHAILEIDEGGTICTGSYGNPMSKTKDNSICLWQYE